MVKKVIQKVLILLFNIITYIPVYIYNLIYSQFYTRWTYYMVADRLDKKREVKAILDIGIGTGHPMMQIMHRIPKTTKVLGIDIDKNYLKYATKIFRPYQNVEIREQNFYLMDESKEMFDVIIFSSSFMIMPDRVKALEIAKKRLNPKGSIFFLLTLEQDQFSLRTQFIERVKPILKMLTTIEFGTITFERAFEKMLLENQLKIIFKEQVAAKSLFLYFFRMFVVEAVVAY